MLPASGAGSQRDLRLGWAEATTVNRREASNDGSFVRVGLRASIGDLACSWTPAVITVGDVVSADRNEWNFDHGASATVTDDFRVWEVNP